MYEVYTAYLGNLCVYVGQGQQGRHKHLKTGKSHSVSANRHHFKCEFNNQPNELNTIVESVNTRKEAMSLEKSKIEQLKPKWNIMLLNKGQPKVYASLDHKPVFKFVSPTGDIYETQTLNAFCKEHGLNQSSMDYLTKGGRWLKRGDTRKWTTMKQHKGWKVF